MLRRLLVFLAVLCVPVAAMAVPAESAEAYGATISVTYDLEAWPCGSGCTGGYQTGYDWMKVSTAGISGGPDFLAGTFGDPGSYYSVYTTNCAIDSVYAHMTAYPGSGANTGSIWISLVREGNVLIGSMSFDSDSSSDTGSGTYDVVMDATSWPSVETTNACLGGPRAIAQWSGTGTATHVRV